MSLGKNAWGSNWLFAREAWRAAIHGVAKSWTRLSDWFDLTLIGASLVAQTVKRLPTTRETWVRSLGWEVPLEKEMATHSSILAWKIPWTEEPGRLQSMGSQRVGHDWATELNWRWEHAGVRWQWDSILLLGFTYPTTTSTTAQEGSRHHGPQHVFRKYWTSLGYD